MSIKEAFIKKEYEKKAAEETEAGEGAKEVKGPSLANILANKEESTRFADYLQTEDQQEIAEKIAKREPLSREETESLAEKRRGYLEIKERAEYIAKTFDIAAIKELAATSPDFKKMTEIYGDEGIRNVLKRYLPEVAIKDRGTFENLHNSALEMEATKKAFGEEEKEMEKLRKQYGIGEKEFVELLQGGDAKDVAKEMRKNLSRWSHPLKRVKTIKAEIEKLAGDNAVKIRAYMDKHTQDMRDLGRLLEAAFIDNEHLSKGLAGELAKDKPEKKNSQMAFSELKENPDEDDVMKEWDIYKAAHNIQPADQDKAAKKFAKSYAQKEAKKRKGLFAQFFADLQAPKVEKIIKK